MPTHVVDCDHSHDEEADGNNEEEMAEHEHDDAHTVNLPKNGHGYGDFANEQTPLLKSDAKRDASTIETGVYQSYHRDNTNIRKWLHHCPNVAKAISEAAHAHEGPDPVHGWQERELR